MARNGSIILASGIGMDKEHKNIINYSSTNMLALLRSQAHFVGEKSDYSFIKEHGKGGNVVDTNFTYQQCKNSNYIAFQNPTYYNKWFFAFIDSVEYINDGTTRITFTVDNWATWFDNLTFKSCFVVREHVNSDLVGEHTIPEDIETGEFINCLPPVHATYDTTSYVCVGVTQNILSQGVDLNPTYGGVASGLIYIVLDNATSLWRLVSKYSSESQLEYIHEVFMIPSNFLPTPITWSKVDSAAADLSGNHWCSMPQSNSATLFETITLQRNTVIGKNYTPKNNRLFSYPFSYMIVSNNVGVDVPFRYEDFTQDTLVPTINFQILGVPCPGCSIKLIPLNYKNINLGTGITPRNYDDSIMCAKYPIGGWIGDVYTNWLTQNAVNLGLNMVGSTMSAIGGMNKGSLSTELSTSMSILSTMANVYQHSLVPYSSNGNSGASDVMYSLGQIAPTIYRMSVKDEYGKIIDDYLTRFGYKVNSLKVPNITGRTYWNYVEIGAGEDVAFGNIPIDAMEEINNIFRSGTTIWHNHANIGNFTLNNTIVVTP